MRTGAKMQKEKKGWSFDEREIKEGVLNVLSDDMTLRLFYVTSGDSGERYETYLLYPSGHRNNPPRTAVAWCNCQNGWYDRLPVLIADLYRKTSFVASDQMCKHAARLIEFLRSESE